MLIDYFVTTHLTIIGLLFRNRKYENYEKYLFKILITVDAIILLSFAIVFPQAQVLVHQCSLITTILGVFVFCLHRIIVNTKKAQVLRIIRIMRSDTPYFDETRVKINEDIHLSENFYPVVTKVLCILVTATIMPYTLLLYNNNIDYNDPAVYVIPYMFHLRDVHTFWGFLMVQMLQAIAIAYFAATYFSFVGLINCVLSNITAHITEVNLQLNDIISDYSIRKNLYPKNDENQNLLADKFINIIKYQLYIQKYVKDFASILSSLLPYYVLQFVFLAFGFIVWGAKMLESNAGTLLQNISVLINLMYGFYTWCNVCENISHANEALLASFYHTEWYKLPLKIRKLMIVTMLHTQRPRIIRAFGIFTINFGMGVQVLKVLYSMVNLLLFKGKSSVI